MAEKHDVPMVKLTGGQRIDLLGIPKENLPKIWADLDMPSGYAYGKSFRTVKTCVGSDFCRFGVGDSTALGIAIEERYQGIEGPGKMKLAVTGCPRNCAEAYVKDLGVVAIDGGRWEIYVGGAAGAHVRKGDLLATVDSPDEVITLTGRFLQYYRENANWLERTYAFVPRIGIDRIRRGRRGRRRRASPPTWTPRWPQSVAAYRDPWKERAEPATPGQFRTVAAADRAAAGAGARMTAARSGRRHPARRGPRLRRRRRDGRRVPAARRRAARPVRGLPAPRRAARRRPDRRQASSSARCT